MIRTFPATWEVERLNFSHCTEQGWCVNYNALTFFIGVQNKHRNGALKESCTEKRQLEVLLCYIQTETYLPKRPCYREKKKQFTRSYNWFKILCMQMKVAMTSFPYMETNMMEKILPHCHSHNYYKELLWVVKFKQLMDLLVFEVFFGSCLSVFCVFLCCFMSVQASWASLRTEFAALNPAQLHHMLREYNSGKACPTGWTPSLEDVEDTVRTGEW